MKSLEDEWFLQTFYSLHREMSGYNGEKDWLANKRNMGLNPHYAEDYE